MAAEVILEFGDEKHYIEKDLEKNYVASRY